MYQALYRKWRPRTFDDVVGQTHITETLKRQVDSGRLSHAYLFTGTRGTGKTTCAKILARAVNCEHPEEGNPCNRCDSCRGIESGSILDVLELDAASNNGVDQVRALRDEAVYTPAAVRKRVYIIDEVHMLSTAAFNALLKILEEPPEHLMFILATTELHKVPATIRSRCQQFAFQRILPGDIAQRLNYVAEQEKIQLTAEGAGLLSRLADGGLRDAISLLDQCAGAGETIGEQQVLDALGLAGNLETARLMSRIADRDTEGALEDIARLYRGGKDISSILGELSALARDLLIRKTAPHSGAALLTGGYDDATMRSLSERLTAPKLAWVLSGLQRALSELPRSSNQRTDAELSLIRLCDDRLDDSAQGLAVRLSQVEAQLDSGLSFSTLKSKKALQPKEGNDEEIIKKPGDQQVKSLVEKKEDEAEKPPWETGLDSENVGEVSFQGQEAATGMELSPAAEEKEKLPDGDTASPAAPVGESLWPGLAAGLKNKVGRNVWCFLGNADMVKGMYEAGVLTLWAADEMIKDSIGRHPVLEAVKDLAQIRLGCPVRVIVKVGSPEPSAAPGSGEAPAHDKLDDLLAFGRQFDTITIKE